MDISIEEKKGKSIYLKVALVIPVFALIIGGIFWMNKSAQHIRVESSELMISTVEQGDLILEVRGTGSLKPQSHHWISSPTRAVLDTLYVKAGDIVRKGQVIMLLSDPELLLELQAKEWRIKTIKAKLKAKSRSFGMELVEQQLNSEKAVYEYNRVSQEVEAEKRLREKNFPGLSNLEWTKLLAEAKHYKEVVQLEKSWIEKIEASRKAEIDVIETELKQCLYDLETIHRKIKMLTIKALHDGSIQNLSAEEGLVVEAGTPLVKVTSIDDFYAELKISQDQIAQVERGQKTHILTRHGNVSGFVRHIHGAVNQGHVLVAIELTGTVPKGAKEGQRVDGVIVTDHLPSAVYVNRPAYIQANQNGWVFRLNKEGNKAERIKVGFGKTGLHKIEIVSGLAVGDRIIVSEMGRWNMEESILIQ